MKCYRFHVFLTAENPLGKITAYCVLMARVRNTWSGNALGDKSDSFFTGTYICFYICYILMIPLVRTWVKSKYYTHSRHRSHIKVEVISGHVFISIYVDSSHKYLVVAPTPRWFLGYNSHDAISGWPVVGQNHPEDHNWSKQISEPGNIWGFY